MTGAHYKAVLSVAPQIIEAGRARKVKHFLVGGARSDVKRDYTQLAEKIPQTASYDFLPAASTASTTRNMVTSEGSRAS